MRLATITNWAYGATLVLTLVSGTTMLLASSAQDSERAAVAQRHGLDQARAQWCAPPQASSATTQGGRAAKKLISFARVIRRLNSIAPDASAPCA